MARHALPMLDEDRISPDRVRVPRHRAVLPTGRHRADTELLAVVHPTAVYEPLDAANTGNLRLRPVKRPALTGGRRRAIASAAVATGLVAITGMAGVGTVMRAETWFQTGEEFTVSDEAGYDIPDTVDVTTIPAPPKPVETTPAPSAPVEPAPAPVLVAKDAPEPILPPPAAPPPQPKPVIPVPAPPAPAPVPVVPKAPAPIPSSPGLKAPAISASARAQLGRFQDCTMLATNALANVGIKFHDWPAGYLSLGSVVSASAAIPGDLIYYANGGMGVAHIAVYDGDGMAIHGGWNGNQTVRFSAYVGSGPVFIRVA